jgi:hypothetical protein
MKVLLIQSFQFLENGRLDKRRRRWLLGMTLPYIGALTPRDIDVQIKDDMLEEITFQENCDLVGLSFMSHQAPRAYQLAAGFRQRGIPVVMAAFTPPWRPKSARNMPTPWCWGKRNRPGPGCCGITRPAIWNLGAYIR